MLGGHGPHIATVLWWSDFGVIWKVACNTQTLPQRLHFDSDLRLLMDLALGVDQNSPFSADSIAGLKAGVVTELASRGFPLEHSAADRSHVPIDHSFLQLLLADTQNPEVHLGAFASGVRVGPGARLPRRPRRTRQRRNGASQMYPANCIEPGE